MFAVGAGIPIVGVVLLLVGETNEALVPADAASTDVALQAIQAPQLATMLPSFSGGAARSAPVPTVPPTAITADEPISASAIIEPESAPEPVDFDLLELVVNRGDSLDALFRRNGLRIADLASMLELEDAAEHLRKLMPGDQLQVTRRGDQVLSLQREIRDDAILAITRNDTGYEAREIEREIEIRIVGRHGVIKSSLFEAGMAAEIPDAVIMGMAGIFQWDIDFIQDVRVDDRFTLLYEERWREGEMLGTRSILAAEFVNRGTIHRVARYTDPNGGSDHYTPDGRSVRKAFVRAPVEFTRISGSFNPNRRHPILNTIRAHRGVDYAAPTGTPIIAAGAGKISHRGPNGGYGNAVIIQHGDNITTLYAHMSRFAKPKRGDRVKQGDVIGYVGQTGLATGPHLHYEYRVNGVHRNPRTVELPAAEPVPAQFRNEFDNTAAVLWRQLDAFQSAWVARVANN